LEDLREEEENEKKKKSVDMKGEKEGIIKNDKLVEKDVTRGLFKKNFLNKYILKFKNHNSNIMGKGDFLIIVTNCLFFLHAYLYVISACFLLY